MRLQVGDAAKPSPAISRHLSSFADFWIQHHSHSARAGAAGRKLETEFVEAQQISSTRPIPGHTELSEGGKGR